MAARRQPEATQGRRGLLIAATIAVSLGIAAWWLSGPDLAAETIVLQQQLLDEAADPKSCQQQLRQIMGNIDRLPAEAIRDVRRELGKSVSGLTRQATTRYLQASPAERPALLDADLGKLQLVLALFDATDRGGMPVKTQADIDRAEQRRKARAKPAAPPPQKATKQAAKKPVEKKTPPTATPAQVYAQALLKHAEKKGVDLGRFGRRLGRG